MLVLDTNTAAAFAAEYGLLESPARGEMLDGGFMNTVVRIRNDAGRSVILKQALPTLRAFPEIHVTPERIRFEHAALKYLTHLETLPCADVPQPLHFDRERSVLAMTDLGANRRRLEEALIAGEIDSETARRLGCFLVALHNASAGQPDLAATFSNTRMHQLRLEHCFFGFCDDPKVVPHIERLAAEFSERRQVLLHGDFWTASVLVDAPKPAVYDLEFCNYGDPAQDVGFMTAHYMLHYFNTPARADAVRAAVEAFWRAYQSDVAYDQDAGFERRVVQQTGVEMLFRVAGLNTVDYVKSPERKDAIATAAKRYVTDPSCTMDTIWS